MTSSKDDPFYTLETTVAVTQGLRAALDLIFAELEYVVGDVPVRLHLEAFSVLED